MGLKVLSDADIEQFMELGYVRVEEAYSRRHALEAQNFMWSRLEERGVNRSDRSTWTEPMVHIRETYDDDAFQVCNTSRLVEAIEDLVGEGRLAERIVYGQDTRKTQWGWWPVNFSSGSDQEWIVPAKGWHWDGIQFRHFVDSPDQGLLCLCMFSDIVPHGGGTLVAEGSHKLVARFLQEQEDGIDVHDGIKMMNNRHPWLAELTGNSPEPAGSAAERTEKFMGRYYTDEDGTRLRVVETGGEAGDVFLCHPFLFHAASQNHLGVPRFMCNRTTPLKEKMNLQRSEEADYSPLERSIRRALDTGNMTV